MKRKSKIKTEKNHTDLDQKINAFHIRNEEKKEEALIKLITEVIVEATLKEYYERKRNNEMKQ